jgi:hypothetical protein
VRLRAPLPGSGLDLDFDWARAQRWLQAKLVPELEKVDSQ